MQKPHLLYLGLSGFPKGLAPIQRQKYIAKSLLISNWDVSIICSMGVYNSIDKIATKGIIEGIYYEYLWGAIRIENFLIRNLFKVISPFKEFFVIYRLKKKKGITAAIISDRNLIWNAIKYRIYSYLLDFKIYINLVEWYKDRNEISLLMKINDYLFNCVGIYFYDGVIAISNYLKENILRFNKKCIIVPIINDTSLFEEICVEKENHIVFCGSVLYMKSILLILKAFSLINNKSIKLILIIGGPKNKLFQIKYEIKKLSIEEQVIIKNNISDFELFSIYKSAKALLLPLFDTVQDKARFPHKFGEYLASGTIVLTNKIGDICNYLSHLENVIFFNENDISDFANWIDWITENQSECIQIGLKGKEVAEKFFDYRLYSNLISSFLYSS